MYIPYLNIDIDLIWLLVLGNMGMILALILILIELQQVRKLRKAFEHMFGHYEELMEKDTKIFWKELEELKYIIGANNNKSTEQ
ncbi:MAG: hypothetical protein JW778_02095 [Candidatus Altiarchaeota archaeon]|nr:hypothetical protein [Candidatus Altiarchaeota archaeon]